MVYVYVNKVAENILKDKMMQRHFEREKNMKKMRKLERESIDSEMRKKKLMKSLDRKSTRLNSSHRR